MKERIILLSLVFLGWIPCRTIAQGLASPPVTTFNPDTSLPKVQVPEFVITGKAEIELPRAYKPSIEIDSSYFQDKNLPGTVVNVPVGLSLSRQQQVGNNGFPNLFVKASIGHYTTTNYVVSGAAETGGGFVVNGSVNGGYSGGFIPFTMRRNVSVLAGISKDLQFDQSSMSSNSIEFGYSRSSYFLYGQLGPTSPYLRQNDDINLKLNSNMDLQNVPLAVGLTFDRSSIVDYWDAVESSIALDASTQIPVSSGWIGGHGTVQFGTHTVDAVTPSPVITLYLPSSNVNRSLYRINLGADYASAALDRDFSFSIGLNYFQYRDDSSSGIAKLFPDIRLNYRLSSESALFARYTGTIRQSGLSDLVSTDRFIDASVPLLSTQEYGLIAVGSRVAISNEVSLTPQFNVDLARYYPMFISGADNSSFLVYADRATVFSFSFAADYVKGDFDAAATLKFQKGRTNSLSDIPNLSPITFDLSAAYQFVPNLTLSGEMLLLSPRYADMTLTRKVGSAGLLSARLSYDVKLGTLPVEFFVEGQNLFNQRYFIWQGYQELPLSLFVGFSSRIL